MFWFGLSFLILKEMIITISTRQGVQPMIELLLKSIALKCNDINDGIYRNAGRYFGTTYSVILLSRSSKEIAINKWLSCSDLLHLHTQTYEKHIFFNAGFSFRPLRGSN